MPMDQTLNPTLMRLAEIEARLTRLEQPMAKTPTTITVDIRLHPDFAEIRDAIRAELIEYMAADAKATGLHLCKRYDDGDFDVEDETLEEWVRFYLNPANEKGAS